MKPIAERTWTGDFEIVYESAKPYTQLLQQLARLAELSVTDIEEQWFFDNDDHAHIRLRYIAQEKTHIIRTARHSDFLDLLVMALLNRQLRPAETRFECSQAEASIWYITAAEKEALTAQGIRFDEPEPSAYFEFVLYNALQSLSAGETEAAYERIAELETLADDYGARNRHNRRLKEVQHSLRTGLLEKIDWHLGATHGLTAEPLYRLVNLPGV